MTHRRRGGGGQGGAAGISPVYEGPEVLTELLLRAGSPHDAPTAGQLVEAVRKVAAGGRYVHPILGAALLTPEPEHARPGGPGGELSDREVEVLRLIALGHTQADISERLYISVRTVESHRAHIHQKLGLRTRSDLVAFASQAGLLTGDEATP